jgi:hypothetical protein
MVIKMVGCAVIKMVMNLKFLSQIPVPLFYYASWGVLPHHTFVVLAVLSDDLVAV